MPSNTKSSDGMPITGYIRQHQLLELVPISKATLWRWVKTGKMVAPVKLSERITAWRCEDVRGWLQKHGMGGV